MVNCKKKIQMNLKTKKIMKVKTIIFSMYCTYTCNILTVNVTKLIEKKTFKFTRLLINVGKCKVKGCSPRLSLIALGNIKSYFMRH